ncbi:F-box only protein 22-like [Uloborus diversus]|uniref:F-box only protein 22-like n=1 Tax=Uloborus diversus TaxID=327109 RepID=UPI002409DC4A|nr:F-box only protein 22-like [Uloborus diversus]
MSFSRSKSAGSVLARSPPILERIFSYLDGRDLDSCTMVCTSWKTMTEIEKKRRKEFRLFFEAPHGRNVESLTGASCSVVFDQYVNIEDDFRKQLMNIRTHPYFCFLFVTSNTVDNFTKLFPSFTYPRPLFKKSRPDGVVARRNYLKAVTQTTVKQHLPVNCDVALSVSSGIIGWRQGDSPLDVESGAGITGLILPKIPGLSIHRFAVDGQHWKITEKIPRNTPIKCLLLFLTYRGTDIIDKIIQSCLHREGCRLAIGGTITDRTESLLGTVVAFCGPNIEAASVILKPDDKKPDVERKLQRFTDSGLLKNKCIAFMFACVARGRHYYRESNVESSIFNRLYPNVPLIGTFGNGEIGHNFLPHLPTVHKFQQKAFIRPRCTKKFLHSYTTVFVMVSFKMN